jgi:hypothetical protein
MPETVWVVGNGPSLSQVPLDLLVGKVCFGVQRIHLIYPSTHWRPTHFVMADRSKATQPGQWLEDVALQIADGVNVFIRSDMEKQILDFLGWEELPDNVMAWRVCEHINGNDRFTSPGKPTTWHQGICKYGGSVPVAIQIAVNWGAEKIRVIGCDLDYKDADNVNHFIRGYQPVDSMTVQEAWIENKTQEHAHQIARAECELRGIDIKNAWPQSKLNVYDKIDFFAALND